MLLCQEKGEWQGKSYVTSRHQQKSKEEFKISKSFCSHLPLLILLCLEAPADLYQKLKPPVEFF